MCLALFLYDVHPTLLLLLAFNRDEFWDRPTLPAHFWPDEPTLLAGRDALRKGTWLGMTRTGRFAFLTNYREPLAQSCPVVPTSNSGSATPSSHQPGSPSATRAAAAAAAVVPPAAAEPASGDSHFFKTTCAPSRGALTTDFLTGHMSPLEYLQGLDTKEYFGFNLLVGDLQQRQVAYMSNRGSRGPQVLPPGVYGVSNGLLQQWPKVEKGLAALVDCIDLPASTLRAGAAAGAGTGGGAAATTAEHKGEADRVGASSNGSKFRPRETANEASAADTDADADAGAAVSNDDSGGDSGECGPCTAGQGVPWQALFQHVMGDISRAAVHEVPLTGVGPDLDHRLSSIFIEPFEMQPGTMYGTRSQTVIAVWRDGRVEQRERYVESQGANDGQSQQQQPKQHATDDRTVGDDAWLWKEVDHSFNL